MDQLDELSFEDALQELEKIVGRLEEGSLTLEEAISLFEDGQQLIARCNKQLEMTSLRVEQLTADGEIVDVSPS